MLPLLLFVLTCVPMALEAQRSERHARRLRARGAIDPPDDVLGAMRVAYPACFLAMIAECWIRGREVDAVVAYGFVLFVASKALKYWAIATLGERWTFRVLVPPGSKRNITGPYRLMRHPNYLAVAGELLGAALMAQAPITGTLAFVGFGGLMLARIRVEERALGPND
jgi:methyltransferase